MKTVQLHEMNDFDKTIAEQVETQCPVFVTFLADINPDTGKYWCPDCVVADPFIKKAVSSVKDSILVECFVGPREIYKNNPNHPYRVHPQIQLKCIPTIIYWKKEGPVKRKELESCDQKTLDDFVKI